MGNMAGYRAAWIDAVEYRDGMNEADPDERPTRDLAMDTLKGVLDGEILIQNHCYRAEEMAMMIECQKSLIIKLLLFIMQ
jgi:imidazolonepropionase-like amidohydrolase